MGKIFSQPEIEEFSSIKLKYAEIARCNAV